MARKSNRNSNRNSEFKCNILGDNLEMNDDVYSLRRRVMGFIYEARAISPLPRIDVRICEGDKDRKYLGAGTVDHRCTLWITENAAKNLSAGHLKEVVYHEIGHAVFKLGHDENCPIMSAKVNAKALSSDYLDEIFASIASRHEGKLSTMLAPVSHAA